MPVSRPPFFQSPTRRQAPPVIRVAGGVDSCRGGIARSFRPPHPPITKAPPTWGSTLRGGGAGDRFCQCRGVGVAAKTCGSGASKHRNPRGCKAAVCFGLVDIPQVTPFFPQVVPFFPYLPFCGFGPSSSLLLLFLEERERMRGANGQKRASTGWKNCYGVCPQVADPIHRFFVDWFGVGFVVWRGLALVLGGDPWSTGGNACVPPCFPFLEGGHGAQWMV